MVIAAVDFRARFLLLKERAAYNVLEVRANLRGEGGD